MPSSSRDDAHADRSGASASTPRLVFYWALVGVPFLWGLSQTILKSLPLFQ